MKKIFFPILFLAFTTLAHGQSKLDSFFKEANVFLETHVENKLIDYEEIKNNPDQLQKLVRQIADISLDEAGPKEKKAFYINSYNILNIHSIVENGIPQSPLDVKGYFDQKKHTVAGKKLTLDELEKETLFPAFPDARVHFVLVCAALGCPPLRPYAYMPDKLDQQIHNATVKTLNSDYFIRVKPEKNSVLISEIFNWYKSDFLKEEDTVLEYINRYRKEKISSDLTVDYYSYDWNLNKQN